MQCRGKHRVCIVEASEHLKCGDVRHTCIQSVTVSPTTKPLKNLSDRLWESQSLSSPAGQSSLPLLIQTEPSVTNFISSLLQSFLMLREGLGISKVHACRCRTTALTEPGIILTMTMLAAAKVIHLNKQRGKGQLRLSGKIEMGVKCRTKLGLIKRKARQGWEI